MSTFLNPATAAATTKPVYETNPKESGVFVGSEGYGFIHLFMDNTQFHKDYPKAQPTDIRFSNPKEASNGNAMLSVLLHIPNGCKVIGNYFPAKGLTLSTIKADKSSMSFTLWGGARDATDVDLVDAF